MTNATATTKILLKENCYGVVLQEYRLLWSGIAEYRLLWSGIVFLFYIKRHLMSGNEFACSLGSSSAKNAWV
ncbi:hypothetical protein PO909_000302 [Leuciscus waleckii]